MRKALKFTPLLLIVFLYGCGKKSDFREVQNLLVLEDSLNLSEYNIHVLSDFNHVPLGNGNSALVDFFGNSYYELNESLKPKTAIKLKEVEKLSGELQVSNIAKFNNGYFIYFPNSHRLVELDSLKNYKSTIRLKYQDDIIADKFSSFFSFDSLNHLFYFSLHRDTGGLKQYDDVPLIGAYNLRGELVQTYGEYPENYNSFPADLTMWKYSFFDWNENNYYAVYNQNNYVAVYDSTFNMTNKIELPDQFIATKELEGKVLNSFKKHPTRDLYFLVENQESMMDDGRKRIVVMLKWFNAEKGTYGQLRLPNYRRIHKIKKDGTIVLFDRNSHEDAYFYLYKLKSAA